jgi:hypothetical protein
LSHSALVTFGMKETQHYKSANLLSVFMLTVEYCNFLIVMLSVIMLNVVAPFCWPLSHKTYWWETNKWIAELWPWLSRQESGNVIIFKKIKSNFFLQLWYEWHIEMKGITRCKLTIISESGICKKFLGQIWSYPASL